MSETPNKVLPKPSDAEKLRRVLWRILNPEGDSTPEDTIARVLAALPSCEGWREIESAPRDGTVFLAYDTPTNGVSCGIILCHWDDEDGYDHDEWPPGWRFTDLSGDCALGCDVRHWMPSPPRPKGRDMNEELKPCPLCSSAEVSCYAYEPRSSARYNPDKYEVVCESCGLISGNHDTRGEAIVHWNRRDTTAVQREREAGLLKFMHDEHLDLRTVVLTTGAGDADVIWHAISFHMDEPKERVIGEGMTPAEALTAAIRARGE